MLLGALEALGTRRAVLISALLFALLHGTLVALPVHFLMGLMLGYLAFAYDSLYAAMAFHIVYNASIVFMAALSEPTAAAQEAIGAQSMFAALGGWSGVLWVAIYALALGLTLRACVRAVERRRRALGIAALPRAQKRIDAASAAMLGVGAGVCALFYALDLVAGMLLPALETLGAGA